MHDTYIEASQEGGIALVKRKISGELVMLNLLRFRETADYSQFPEIAPKKPISGKEAYQKYIEFTQPFLEASGGELMFLAEGGNYLIGPGEESWDAVMLVKQRSVEDFFAFASNEDYLAGMGHRTAALLDSRLLPLRELSEGKL